ncbi:MAG: DUF883 family protein [Acidiferrobacter sp.]
MDKTDSLNRVLDRLLADFRTVLADGESLLDATAKEGGEALGTLRAQMAGRLDDAKARISQVEDAVSRNAAGATKAAEDYVGANPWQSLLVVGGVAALVGYLVGRIGSSRK